jgi:NTP pyrophosphatase (non-canonical NTP hydrolase)
MVGKPTVNIDGNKNMENSPINKLQQLMIITAEECGELTQRCSKIVRKFEYKEEITDAEREKLLEEVGDVYCMINLMTEHGILDWKHIYARSSVKEEKLKKWSQLIGS